MARPRAATDDQIFEAAEELAQELGWNKVFGSTVREHLDVGGSLSTFTTAVKRWRDEKESSEKVEEKSAAEVVENRVSIIDESLSNVAVVLKSMREVVTNEIDRAVSDERKKSDRIRADEREIHEQMSTDLSATIDAISAENDSLGKEALEEAQRADEAEDALRSLTQVSDERSHRIEELESSIEQMSQVETQLRNEIATRDSVLDEQDQKYKAAIAKAEAREFTAIDAREKVEAKVEELRAELKSATADISTARADVVSARADRSKYDELLVAARAEIDELKEAVGNERKRADEAWQRADKASERIDALTAELKAAKPKERA